MTKTKLLADILVKCQFKDGLNFLRKNSQARDILHLLSIRTGGEIESISEEDLFDFYLSRLGDISSFKALEDALLDGMIDLEIKLDDYIDSQKRDKIFEDNSESIRLNDHDYKIQYVLSGMGATKLMMVSAKIPAKELFDIKNIQPLKSGRSLLVEATDERGAVIASWPANELAELKKKVGRYFNKALWDEKKPYDKFIGFIRDFSDKLLPPLPGPESIGVDPLTSEALIAYPAYTISMHPLYFREVQLKYYMEKEEAEKVQHLTEVEIAKMPAEERSKKKWIGKSIIW